MSNYSAKNRNIVIPSYKFFTYMKTNDMVLDSFYSYDIFKDTLDIFYNIITKNENP